MGWKLKRGDHVVISRNGLFRTVGCLVVRRRMLPRVCHAKSLEDLMVSDWSAKSSLTASTVDPYSKLSSKEVSIRLRLDIQLRSRTFIGIGSVALETLRGLLGLDETFNLAGVRTASGVLNGTGLGFEFEPRKTGWDARMQELKGYKALYHNCNVPIGDVNYPELARWVKQQRADHKALMEGKQSPLTKERWDELEKIGFEWVLREKKAKAAEDTDDSAKAKAAAPLESKKRGNDHAYHSDTDDEVEIEKDDSPPPVSKCQRDMETRPRMKSRRELKNFMNRGHGK